MANCLVIGGNGFIGANLCTALANSGHQVLAFDRFSRGIHAVSHPNVGSFIGDFMSRSDLAAALKDQDYVFHFLSTTTPITAESEPSLDLRTNVSQTVDLLELCVAANIKRFYYSSSGGAIYGPQGRSLYAESNSTLPVSPYGIGKLTIENYLRYFRVRHGLDSISLRISNPYGAGQSIEKRQGIIPIVLHQVASGGPISRLGDGTMIRDYLFIDDLVRMILLLVDRRPQYDVYNLGSGQGSSVNTIFDSIRRVTGVDFVTRDLPKPSTFVDHVVLDMTRFTTEFGKPNLTTLDAGVNSVWDLVREQTGQTSSTHSANEVLLPQPRPDSFSTSMSG
ncbi:NAD-dependent epimerase/dehydratase family protein [Cryobacterium frigoriphilum]|uniref:UDP-glucose 4-epimerase n=1 Tax=Cryobacterium frigoriphilum TaxID=1259150 RepID=A0A4V3IRQ7_9MICO|nr:NAD-dependent epimerase/dehydratase family protein [Cryobacterium frigoriphilum]TFD53009.1 NAD-dependent epimerase/dehydratase family protein [Cryobacterium frigoriphilum]